MGLQLDVTCLPMAPGVRAQLLGNGIRTLADFGDLRNAPISSAQLASRKAAPYARRCVLRLRVLRTNVLLLRVRCPAQWQTLPKKTQLRSSELRAAHPRRRTVQQVRYNKHVRVLADMPRRRRMRACFCAATLPCSHPQRYRTAHGGGRAACDPDVLLSVGQAARRGRGLWPCAGVLWGAGGWQNTAGVRATALSQALSGHVQTHTHTRRCCLPCICNKRYRGSAIDRK